MMVDRTANRLATTIGLISIGFGIFDTIRARRLATNVGMESDLAFRLAGAREIATGFAALVPPFASVAILLRLAGDAVDLATLGLTAAKPSNEKRATALLGVAVVAAVTLVDAIAMRQLPKKVKFVTL